MGDGVGKVSGIFDKFMEGMKTGVKSTAEGLGGLESAASGAGAFVSKLAGPVGLAIVAVNALCKQVDALFVALERVTAIAVNFVESFARAGLAASAAGQVLNVQMERLSRTVSGLFGPEIQAFTRFIGDVTSWIERLDQSQKKTLAFWVIYAKSAQTASEVVKSALDANPLVDMLKSIPLIGGIFEFMEKMIARTTGAIAGLFAATEGGQTFIVRMMEALKPVGELIRKIFFSVSESFQQLTSAIFDLFTSLTPVIARFAEVLITTVKPAIDAVLAGLKAVAQLIERMAHAIAKLTGANLTRPIQGNRNTAAPRFGGIDTSPDAAYFRIAQATLMMSFGQGTHEERVETHLRGIEKNTAGGVAATQDVARRTVPNVGK
jgi:phage-related protein